MSAPLAVPEDISRNRGRLLRLAESIKTRKLKGGPPNAAGAAAAPSRGHNIKNDPGYSPNIEHLVFGGVYRNATTAAGSSRAAVADQPQGSLGLTGPLTPTTPVPSLTPKLPPPPPCGECVSIRCDLRACACRNNGNSSNAGRRRPAAGALDAATAAAAARNVESGCGNSNCNQNARRRSPRVAAHRYCGANDRAAGISEEDGGGCTASNVGGSAGDGTGAVACPAAAAALEDRTRQRSATRHILQVAGPPLPPPPPPPPPASAAASAAAGQTGLGVAGVNRPLLAKATAAAALRTSAGLERPLAVGDAGSSHQTGVAAAVAAVAQDIEEQEDEEEGRRRPLTLTDQVFLSPLLRNPNSVDPTGILSPPSMFKDTDPTAAIEAAVNRWVGADSRESAALLNQLANIAESRLARCRRPPPSAPPPLMPLNLLVGGRSRRADVAAPNGRCGATADAAGVTVAGGGASIGSGSAAGCGNGGVEPRVNDISNIDAQSDCDDLQSAAAAATAAAAAAAAAAGNGSVVSSIAGSSSNNRPRMADNCAVPVHFGGSGGSGSSRPQTPARSKPARRTDADWSASERRRIMVADDDYGFLVAQAARDAGCSAVTAGGGELLSRTRSIPEIAGMTGGLFFDSDGLQHHPHLQQQQFQQQQQHLGSRLARLGRDLGGTRRRLGSSSNDTLAALLLLGEASGRSGGQLGPGRPRSMHDNLLFDLTTYGDSEGIFVSDAGNGHVHRPFRSTTEAATDITQLGHLQEPTSHSCNSSPQKIFNRFSKTFSLRRNRKKQLEKGCSLESEVPLVKAEEHGSRLQNICNRDNDHVFLAPATGNSGSNCCRLQQRPQQTLSVSQHHGVPHRSGFRTEHSPSLSKDSGIHLNSNSTEETTSSKSGSEDGNSSFNPRRSRALQRGSRKYIRRSQSQPCEINTSSEAEDDDDAIPMPSIIVDTISGVCDPALLASVANGYGHLKEIPDIVYVEALWDHITLDSEELAFRAGGVIRVTDRTDRDWWWGALAGCPQGTGWFPANFVRLRVNQDTKDGALQDYTHSSAEHVQEMYRIRGKVVQELLNTEQDFVRHLRDIVEGYLLRCRSCPAMFSAQQVSTIFGNIEQLYVFQKSFLCKLTACVDSLKPHSSSVGDCFLRFRNDFTIYSDYCNNHPLAMAELEQLYRQPEYARFFEECRHARGGMSDISLDGFLLTPVQRICKYPLQLAELLKYTPEGHPDRKSVTLALESMRGVAHMVNERKRRMESLETLDVWQRAVLNWEGPELIETSSLLVHSGDVTRYTLSGLLAGSYVNSGSQQYNKEVVTMWLFDNVIIYCRREFIRGSLSYRGRIYTSALTLVNIPDGKEPNFGISVKNAFKLYCASTEKWFLFSCRSPKDKNRWISAFDREREIVWKDKELGYTITENTRKLTRLSILNKARPHVQGRRAHRPDAAITEALDVEEGRLLPLKNRSGSLPSHFASNVHAVNKDSLQSGKDKKWYHFGSSKKVTKKRV